VAVAAVVQLVNMHVPEPYMDEIFHVPQTQRWCALIDRGVLQHWDWDPSITTFPGLYVFSVMVHTVIGVPCTLVVLRGISVCFAVGNVLVVYVLTQRKVMQSLEIVLNPIVFFYAPLFYTDTGSTFFVLLAYLFSQKRWTNVSAIVSFARIFFLLRLLFC
jgi:alpha-1,2-glucosyltransferase